MKRKEEAVQVPELFGMIHLQGGVFFTKKFFFPRRRINGNGFLFLGGVVIAYRSWFFMFMNHEMLLNDAANLRWFDSYMVANGLEMVKRHHLSTLILSWFFDGGPSQATFLVACRHMRYFLLPEGDVEHLLYSPGELLLMEEFLRHLFFDNAPCLTQFHISYISLYNIYIYDCFHQR